MTLKDAKSAVESLLEMMRDQDRARELHHRWLAYDLDIEVLCNYVRSLPDGVTDEMVERALVAGFAAHIESEPMAGCTWARFCKDCEETDNMHQVKLWRELARAALLAALTGDTK